LQSLSTYIYRWPAETLSKSILEHMSKLFIKNPLFALKSIGPSKMPAFTLYGARGSTNADRVRLTLAEGGFTDYELVILNMQKGEHKVRQPSPTEI
jgi:hypothetical protein